MRIWPRSLRSRLAVLFALGAGVLLAGSSLFLWRNLTDELDRAVTAGLRQRAADLGADVAANLIHPGQPLTSEVLDHEPFAQILQDGRVIGASPTLVGRGPVIGTAQAQRAIDDGAQLVDREVAGLGHRSRLLVAPAAPGTSSTVVVVGTSLDAIHRAQRRLRIVLAVTSPVLLSLLAAAGWFLAGAALRPVRRMTEEASVLSLDDTGRRLPIPPGEDEIALLGRTLNGMLDRIRASIVHERRFLDDASHELRTPIAILRAELELALLDAEDEGSRAGIRSALDEAERLAAMAEDLLVLARSDAGSAVRRPAGGRVPATVVARRVADRLATAEVAVAVEGADTGLEADEQVLEQVLTNLVANAVRFAHGAVSVSVGRDELSVADDGPGFPEDLLPRAFERFARSELDRGRDGGGAGLGLAIVDALVRSLGGTVEATNGPPLGGGCVRVRFPGTDALSGTRGSGSRTGSRRPRRRAGSRGPASRPGPSASGPGGAGSTS